MVGDPARYVSEVSHDGFDRHIDERRRQHLNCFADKRIAVTECKDEAGSTQTIPGRQQSCCQTVFRGCVYRICARTRRQCKPGIICSDGLNCAVRHVLFQLTSVTELSAATHREYASSDKPGFG